MWTRLAPAAEEIAQRARRVVGVDRGLPRVALSQAHRLAAHQIDGGDGQHQARPPRMKLRRKRSPDHWLFSGWNWQPNTLPRTIVAGNSTLP